MIFPIEELIRYNGNMYEITSAASRRAHQLSKLQPLELEANYGKAVSLAARQIFFHDVRFTLMEEDGIDAISEFPVK
ncbi:MAG: DNA-directed RNA polymerase subunit omega [Spirochaetaceae bacterium]|jgi:DNA-directed RNA polymerase subunit omega|nr:DNA-directed RNA polymerase subunit omega [Spirochaetaceae bacterium]